MEKDHSTRKVTISSVLIREPFFIYHVDFMLRGRVITMVFNDKPDAFIFRNFIKTASIREVSCVEL